MSRAMQSVIQRREPLMCYFVDFGRYHRGVVLLAAFIPLRDDDVDHGDVAFSIIPGVLFGVLLLGNIIMVLLFHKTRAAKKLCGADMPACVPF